MRFQKICLVIHSLQPGGMERVMCELANYMCSQTNLEVHLVMFGIKPEIFYKLPDKLIIHKPDWKFDNSNRIRSTIKRMTFLRKEIKKIKPSSVLSFGEIWNNFVLLALVGLKYPVFVSDRCQPDKSLGRLNDLLRRLLYSKATGIVAQTTVARKIYSQQFYHDNFKVIGNPIRTIQSQPTGLKENIILSVGRLIESKHFDELIRIFANIDAVNWRLIIVGDDAIKQQNKTKLEVLIRELNMEEKIILAGKQSDVDSFYLKSKIFAFTSSSEGFPNVIGEAQSAGLPVVAFDCIAGPSDMIEDGVNGFLIPLFDYILFENKLRQLIENPELRIQLGSNAVASVKQFSVELIGQQFLNFISKNENSSN